MGGDPFEIRGVEGEDRRLGGKCHPHRIDGRARRSIGLRFDRSFGRERVPNQEGARGSLRLEPEQGLGPKFPLEFHAERLQVIHTHNRAALALSPAHGARVTHLQDQAKRAYDRPQGTGWQVPLDPCLRCIHTDPNLLIGSNSGGRGGQENHSRGGCLDLKTGRQEQRVRAPIVEQHGTRGAFGRDHFLP